MNHDYTIKITDVPDAFDLEFEKISEIGDVVCYKMILKSEEAAELSPMTIQWKIPAHNIKGVWSTNALHAKRLKADWEGPTVVSRVSVDAPVVAVYSHTDENVISFACADVINTVILSARVREEDNFLYCQIKLFSEAMPLTKYYETQILVDSSQYHFSKGLKGISKWWASNDHLRPLATPPAAKLPLYSTWYAYHQEMTIEVLLAECKIAKKMGCELIIIDDGWQTMDNNRGYDYTGDWQAERFTEMKAFVAAVHALGMKVMLWYSVPFCGPKSKAFQKFKGKFLTENHRWAPVFDPRYAEIRNYLIDIYTSAAKDWNLDGFKLDFIDEFRIYPETELNMGNGRDYASVNEAVDCLLQDVAAALQQVKPDILIEFRQKYIGPAMRKYGNMFRAFDAPNDSLSNRIRIADVKMLCDTTAVHSDMFTWHYEEAVEIAALQLSNIFFSVPQISVRLAEIPDSHKAMIDFYLKYWLSKKEIFMDGHFKAHRPSANYPILSGELAGSIIYGVYDERVVEVNKSYAHIDLINGKASTDLIIDASIDLGEGQMKIYDCQGQILIDQKTNLGIGLHKINVPISGIVSIVF